MLRGVRVESIRVLGQVAWCRMMNSVADQAIALAVMVRNLTVLYVTNPSLLVSPRGRNGFYTGAAQTWYLLYSSLGHALYVRLSDGWNLHSSLSHGSSSRPDWSNFFLHLP